MCISFDRAWPDPPHHCDRRLRSPPAGNACYGSIQRMHVYFGKQLMAWSEEDIVRALARVGTKGLTTAALAKAISASASNKQLSSAITKLKSCGAVRGPFRIGRSSLLFEAKSAPTREYLESRIEDVLRRAGTR